MSKLFWRDDDKILHINTSLFRLVRLLSALGITSASRCFQKPDLDWTDWDTL